MRIFVLSIFFSKESVQSILVVVAVYDVPTMCIAAIEVTLAALHVLLMTRLTNVKNRYLYEKYFDFLCEIVFIVFII